MGAAAKKSYEQIVTTTESLVTRYAVCAPWIKKSTSFYT